jgi:hypothetical protein
MLIPNPMQWPRQWVRLMGMDETILDWIAFGDAKELGIL